MARLRKVTFNLRGHLSMHRASAFSPGRISDFAADRFAVHLRVRVLVMDVEKAAKFGALAVRNVHPPCLYPNRCRPAPGVTSTYCAIQSSSNLYDWTFSMIRAAAEAQLCASEHMRRRSREMSHLRIVTARTINMSNVDEKAGVPIGNLRVLQLIRESPMWKPHAVGTCPER